MDEFQANSLAPEATDVHGDTGTIEAIENDREFKAHIYQQLVDLQPFLSPESQIAVLVQQDSDQDEAEAHDHDQNTQGYTLTLVATLGEYRLESEGHRSDLYEAFGIAKAKMREQLEELHSAAVDSAERDARIRMLLAGGYTVH